MTKEIESLQKQIAEKDRLDKELIKEKKRMGIMGDDEAGKDDIRAKDVDAELLEKAAEQAKESIEESALFS